MRSKKLYFSLSGPCSIDFSASQCPTSVQRILQNDDGYHPIVQTSDFQSLEIYGFFSSFKKQCVKKSSQNISVTSHLSNILSKEYILHNILANKSLGLSNTKFLQPTFLPTYLPYISVFDLQNFFGTNKTFQTLEYSIYF